MQEVQYNKVAGNPLRGLSQGPLCNDQLSSSPKQVSSALAQLNEDTLRLQSIIEELWKRLDCVVRHDPETPCNSDKCSAPAILVDVADKINTQSVRIDQIIGSINTLLTKLEL